MQELSKKTMKDSLKPKSESIKKRDAWIEIRKTKDQKNQDGCLTSICETMCRCYSSWNRNVLGRNGMEMSYRLFALIFKIIWGLWDEASDWLYWSNNEINSPQDGGFQSDDLRNLMLFFLVAQYFVQLFAWMIIFGQVKINEFKESDEPKGILTVYDFIIKLIRQYDMEEALKNENSFFIYIFKSIFYSLYNLLTIIYQSFSMLHYAITFTIMNETKWTPFFIHWYFQKHHNIVLTQGLMNNMMASRKKTEGIKVNKQRNEIMKTLNKSEKISLLSQSEDNRHQEIEKDPDSHQRKKEKYLNIALDANMEANLATFLFEADLEKYLRMTDTIEAIFEAMPMAILVYVNNQMKISSKIIESWNLIDLLTFISSVGTITIYCVSLIKHLFQEDADVLMEQKKKMCKILEDNNNKNSSKSQNQTNMVAEMFEFPEKVEIYQKKDLLKFQQSNVAGGNKVRKLKIILDKSKQDTGIIIESLSIIPEKTPNLSYFKISLSDCDVVNQQFRKILVCLNNFHALEKTDPQDIQCLEDVTLELQHNKGILNPQKEGNLLENTTNFATNIFRSKKDDDKTDAQIIFEDPKALKYYSLKYELCLSYIRTQKLLIHFADCKITYPQILLFFMGVSGNPNITSLILNYEYNDVADDQISMIEQIPKVVEQIPTIEIDQFPFDQKKNEQIIIFGENNKILPFDQTVKDQKNIIMKNMYKTMNDSIPLFNLEVFEIDLSSNCLGEQGVTDFTKIIVDNFKSANQLSLNFSGQRKKNWNNPAKFFEIPFKQKQIQDILEKLYLNLSGKSKLSIDLNQKTSEKSLLSQLQPEQAAQTHNLTDEYIKKLTENFLAYFTKIKDLELYLGFNQIDKSLSILSDRGFKSFKNLQRLILDLRSNQISKKTLLNFAENYTQNLEKVSYLVLDFRYNNSLKNNYFYNHRVLLNNDVYDKDKRTYNTKDLQKNFNKQVPEVIKELLNFNLKYLIMNVDKVSTKLFKDNINKPSFKIGEQFLINFSRNADGPIKGEGAHPLIIHQKQVLEQRHLSAFEKIKSIRSEDNILCEIKSIKPIKTKVCAKTQCLDNIVQVGRNDDENEQLEMEKNKQIVLAEKNKEIVFSFFDNTVSRQQCQIMYDYEQDQYLILNQSETSQCEFVIKKNRYQLFQKSVITIGSENGKIQLVVELLGESQQQTQLIQDKNQNAFTNIQLEKISSQQNQTIRYLWSHSFQTNDIKEEKEHDSDATEKDESDQDVKEEENVDKNAKVDGFIRLRIKKLTNKYTNQLSFDYNLIQIEEQKGEKIHKQIFVGQNPDADFFQQNCETLRIKTEKNQESHIAALHCIIGYEIYKGKNLYYLEVPVPDTDGIWKDKKLQVHPRRTQLQFTESEQVENRFYELQNEMNISMGYTDFQIKINKNNYC